MKAIIKKILTWATWLAVGILLIVGFNFFLTQTIQKHHIIFFSIFAVGCLYLFFIWLILFIGWALYHDLYDISKYLDDDKERMVEH